jgi:hypothetical protein
MSDQLIYIYHLYDKVNEGGMARNNAFHEKFKTLDSKMFNVFTKNIAKRLLKLLQFIIILIVSKSKTIFIHQGTFFYLCTIPILRVTIFRRVIINLLKYSSNKNKVIFEINDLPYEQSKDLKLKVDTIFQILQIELYRIKKCKFIFASFEMQNYAERNYYCSKEKSLYFLGQISFSSITSITSPS